MLSPINEQMVRVCLAGPVGGNRFLIGGRVRTARHEASHAVIAWTLGMHVGEVSIEPLNDASGYAQLSFSPITKDIGPDDLKRKRGTPFTDEQRVARLVTIEAPGWKQTIREIRSARTRTAQMVRANWDVIDALADELLDRGRIPRTESVPLLERIEADLIMTALTAFDENDTETLRNVPATTLARIRSISECGVPDRALWARISEALSIEIDRRNLQTIYIDELNAYQNASKFETYARQFCGAERKPTAAAGADRMLTESVV